MRQRTSKTASRQSSLEDGKCTQHTRAIDYSVQVPLSKTSFRSLTFKAALYLKLIFNHYLLTNTQKHTCEKEKVIRVFPTSWLSRPRPLRPDRSWEAVMKTPAGIHALFSKRQNKRISITFFMDRMRGVSGVNLAYKVIFCYRPLPHPHYVLSPFHFFKLIFYRLLFFKSFPTVSDSAVA